MEMMLYYDGIDNRWTDWDGLDREVEFIRCPRHRVDDDPPRLLIDGDLFHVNECSYDNVGCLEFWVEPDAGKTQSFCPPTSTRTEALIRLKGSSL